MSSAKAISFVAESMTGRAATTPVSTPWLTVAQVAARAQCGRSLVYSAIRDGKLRAAHVGGGRSIRVLDEWCDLWLVACSEPREARRSL